MLPEQKQIDELLKAMGNGSLPPDTARARLGDLRDELSKLDPKLQNAMASARERIESQTAAGPAGYSNAMFQLLSL